MRPKNYLLSTVSLLLGLYSIILLPSAATAADPADISAIVPLCQSCHGSADQGADSGKPIDANTPILAGQEYYYLYVQLKDYKADRRANPVMSNMVKDLTKDEMKALATHFSSMDWPGVASDTDKTLANAGGSALSAGQCSQCHSTYQGDSRIPRLAGQQLPYLVQTMKDFKNKVRLNSPAKGSLMDSFSDDDIEAMGHYLADL